MFEWLSLLLDKYILQHLLPMTIVLFETESGRAQKDVVLITFTCLYLSFT